MALRGQFLRRILGGGIITRSLEGRKSFPRLQSTLTSPRLFIDGVSPSITDEKIKQAFAPFGNLVEGYIRRTHYHSEAGGKYANKGEVEKQRIQKGDTISLKDLLFTKNRDYLVKNNNEHVKAEQLEGKVVAIYFLPLYVPFPNYSEYYTSLLKDVYFNLLPKNNFEVVVVASKNWRAARIPGYNRKLAHPAHAKDPQIHFDELFSGMPWTAIPYSDVASRESMEKAFGIGVVYCSATVFIIDSTGMVLQGDNWDVFNDFGATGYPFSDERLEFMRAEDDAAAKQPSLRTLLTTPEHDYVISNKGDKVPVCTIENKVVALYFHHAYVANHSLTVKLKAAYNMLAASNSKFEVVLVYISRLGVYESMSDGEHLFWKEFKTMPWLALPFGDDRCKKLRRVFKISDDGESDPNELVIIGPHSEFIEPFGGRVLLQYDFSAYPFTCKKAVELEIEKLKDLKLEMLWDKNTFFRRNNGSQVPFSELFGKRIMLVLERIGCRVDDLGQNSPNANFLQMLKGRYIQTEGTDDEFEVIRILVDNMEFSTSQDLDLGDESCLTSLARELGNMHWIVSLASDMTQNICCSNFWYGFPIDEFPLCLPILAFNRDGRIVRKLMIPTFVDVKFPFSSIGLEEEMLSEFTELNEIVE